MEKVLKATWVRSHFVLEVTPFSLSVLLHGFLLLTLLVLGRSPLIERSASFLKVELIGTGNSAIPTSIEEKTGHKNVSQVNRARVNRVEKVVQSLSSLSGAKLTLVSEEPSQPLEMHAENAQSNQGVTHTSTLHSTPSADGLDSDVFVINGETFLGSAGALDNGDPVRRYLDRIYRMLLRSQWYPEMARQAGIEGLVKVQLTIDELGLIQEVVVKEASHDLLKEGTLVAFQRLRKLLPPPPELGMKQIKLVVPIRYRIHE